MKTCSTPALLLLALAVMPACGGGDFEGGGDPSISNPPPGTSPTHLLVEPAPGKGQMEGILADLGGEVVGEVPGTAFLLVEPPAGEDLPGFGRRLQRDPRVRHVELDRGMSTPEGDGSTLPAGGLLLASAIPAQEEFVRIGAEIARTRAAGSGVVVAVVDSGLVPHDFVDPRVAPGGWDLVDDDPDPTDERDGGDTDGDGLVDECWGHGLFVASLVVGVAPEARILTFRVLDADGVGMASRIATAIHLAAEGGAHVVNLSLGMDTEVAVLDAAVRNARDRGVAVITSAGNTGLEDVRYPAALEEAFSVTAVDAADRLAAFASYGPEVDLSAPGVDLLGAYPSGTGTARWSGTSFSAALTSGAFALLREMEPASDARALLDRLAETAAPVVDSGGLPVGLWGAGRLDLDAATR